MSDGNVGSALNSNAQVERDASIDDLFDRAVSAIHRGHGATVEKPPAMVEEMI